MRVALRSSLTGGVCGTLVGLACALFLQTTRFRLPRAICSTAVGAFSGIFLGAVFGRCKQEHTKRLPNSPSKVVPQKVALPCEDGGEAGKVVLSSSDTGRDSKDSKDKDVNSLDSAECLKKSRSEVLKNKMSKKEQEYLIQKLERIAEQQRQQQQQEQQRQMISDEQPTSSRMDADIESQGDPRQEAGSLSASTALSFVSMSSSVAAMTSQGSRLFAERCRICGKRQGTILGMKGFGLRQRGHERRCAKRHGLILDASGSFVSNNSVIAISGAQGG
eukprot:TRINITY_DN10856_c0_g2_i1.p1 TRINITY_DN10856_c0_g2~~TRINITY_DN10856_c0_g2_i1.p1  ORF type:complete len:276 (-),score=70.89 TRINITY_DN10856_c0_g2_i1:123-950(-)